MINENVFVNFTNYKIDKSKKENTKNNEKNNGFDLLYFWTIPHLKKGNIFKN